MKVIFIPPWMMTIISQRMVINRSNGSQEETNSNLRDVLANYENRQRNDSWSLLVFVLLFAFSKLSIVYCPTLFIERYTLDYI